MLVPRVAARLFLMLLVVPTDFRLPRGLSCWAWPLCVPVDDSPPARSPHASLRLGVVDLEARPGPPDPPAPSTPAAPAVLCVVAHRLVVRPSPADPAAPSHRWLVVCVLPGQALCGLCGACAEHEEACDCCRQYERADAHVHKGAGCLSDKEPLKQPGEQEETEEAPHASRCACHQLL